MLVNCTVENLFLHFSFHFNCHYLRGTWITWYQHVSILDFTGANDDAGGGDNWSYKTCKALVKLSPSIHQDSGFYSLDTLPVAQPTVSEHSKEEEPSFDKN